MSFWGWLATGLAVAAAAAVVVTVLCADEIVSWFQGRLSQRKVHTSHVGVTVLQCLDTGNYQVVQGIFDTTTQEVVERRVIEAERIDADLRNAHDKDGIAIWT